MSLKINDVIETLNLLSIKSRGEYEEKMKEDIRVYRAVKECDEGYEEKMKEDIRVYRAVKRWNKRKKEGR